MSNPPLSSPRFNICSRTPLLSLFQNLKPITTVPLEPETMNITSSNKDKDKDRLCLAFYDRNGHKGFHIALLIHPKKSATGRSPLLPVSSSPLSDAPYDVYDVTNTLTSEYPDARWRYRARHFDGPMDDKALIALVLVGKISSGQTGEVVKVLEGTPALPTTEESTPAPTSTPAPETEPTSESEQTPAPVSTPDAPKWDCHQWVHNCIIALQERKDLVQGLDDLPPWNVLMTDSDAFATKKKEDFLKLRPFDFRSRTMTLKKNGSSTKK